MNNKVLNKPKPDYRNGWTLCLSKTFPGKYYYFNALTGETEWCSNDALKAKVPVRPDLHPPPMTHKYTYHEPNSQPVGYMPSAPPQFIDPPCSVFPKPYYHQVYKPPTPTYPVNPYLKYPQYTFKTCTNNHVVEPQQWSHCDTGPMSPESYKTFTIDKGNNEHTKTPSIHIHHHSTSTYLSQRFSEPLQDCQNVVQDVAVQTHDDTLLTKDSNNNSKQLESATKKDVNSGMSEGSKNVTYHNENVNKHKQCETQEKNICKNCKKNVTLSENDLRHRLNNKHRNVEDAKKVNFKHELDNSNTTKSSEKPLDKTITCDPENHEKHMQKDMQHANESIEQDDITTTKVNIDVTKLRNLLPKTNFDQWYIVVDFDTLIKEYFFVMSILEADTHCRLLLPTVVKGDLLSLATSNSRSSEGVIVARQLLRRIMDWQKCGKVVDENIAESEHSGINIVDILVCCRNAIKRNPCLMFVSNNTELAMAARTQSIPHYTVEDLKVSVTQTNNLSFDAKQIKVLVKNDTNPDESAKNDKIIVINDKKVVNNDNDLVKNGKIIIVNDKNNNNDSDLVKNDKITVINDKTVVNNDNELVKNDSYNQSVKKPIKTQNNDLKPDLNHNKMTCDNHHKNIKSIFDIDAENTDGSSNSSKCQEKTDVKGGKFDRIDKEQFSTDDDEIETESVYFQKDTDEENSTKDIAVGIQESMKRFLLNDNDIMIRLKLRIDEFALTFTQIIEDALHDVLMIPDDGVTKYTEFLPPWTVHEAVQLIKKKFPDEKAIVLIADKISNLLGVTGHIPKDIKPGDFLVIFGYGFLLIEELNEMPENATVLEEPLNKLEGLLAEITGTDVPADKGGDRDQIVAFFDKIVADVGFVEGRQEVRNNKFEVERYLKRHFPNINMYVNPDDVANNNDNIKQVVKSTDNDTTSNQPTAKKCKVLRTTGVDVKKLKLHSARDITMEKSPVNKLTVDKKSTHDLDGECQPVNSVKVVTNLNITDKYERRIGDNLMESSMMAVSSDMSIDKCHNEVDSSVLTRDSGIDKSDDSVNVQSFAKMFLVEIKSSFILLYDFLTTSINDLEEGISGPDRRRLASKTNIAQEHLQKIVRVLNSIKEREATESESVTRVMRTEADLEQRDVQLSRYPQVIAKCLEQAGYFDQALSLLQSVTNDKVNLKLLKEIEKPPNFYNIFE